MKADKAFSILLSFQKRYPSLSFGQFLHLYMCLVYPVLSYSSEVFGWKLANQLDSIFVEHLRRYLGVPKHVSGMAIHWLTGTRPLQYYIYKKGYKFWETIAGFPSYRLEKSAYVALTTLTSKSWFSEMIAVFEEIGFSGNYIEWQFEQISANRDTFLNCVNTYFDAMNQNSSSQFGRASFLDRAAFYDRRLLARFWLRCFHFEAICGTRHSLLFKERFCLYCIDHCSRAVLGDEIHYLAHCPRFSQLRLSVCSSLNISSDDLESITCRMASIDCTILHISYYRILAKFFRMAFNTLADPYRQS